jgi:hypothetical protein
MGISGVASVTSILLEFRPFPSEKTSVTSIESAPYTYRISWGSKETVMVPLGGRPKSAANTDAATQVSKMPLADLQKVVKNMAYAL